MDSQMLTFTWLCRPLLIFESLILLHPYGQPCKFRLRLNRPLPRPIPVLWLLSPSSMATLFTPVRSTAPTNGVSGTPQAPFHCFSPRCCKMFPSLQKRTRYEEPHRNPLHVAGSFVGISGCFEGPRKLSVCLRVYLCSVVG